MNRRKNIDPEFEPEVIDEDWGDEHFLAFVPSQIEANDNYDQRLVGFPHNILFGVVIRRPSGLELQSCRRWFENCLKEAKIEDFDWHDLQHTAASRLRAQNVHIEDIRYLLGHGAKSITERYAHPPMDLLRTVVAKLDRKPESQTDTKTDTGALVEFRPAIGA